MKFKSKYERHLLTRKHKALVGVSTTQPPDKNPGEATLVSVVSEGLDNLSLVDNQSAWIDMKGTSDEDEVDDGEQCADDLEDTQTLVSSG